MKTTFRTFFASSLIALATFGGASSALASDTEPLHVSVPFSFRAGKTMLPAGDYSVYSENSNVIMIKGAQGSAIVLGLSSTEGVSDKAGVSFDRDAAGYCLRSVHVFGKTASTRIVDSGLPLDK